MTRARWTGCLTRSPVLSLAAVELNAAANGVAIRTLPGDQLDTDRIAHCDSADEFVRLLRANDGRPFSSKNLLECYRRADKHWARRDEVRARSEGAWKRGVGLASQIWYGGGGPPSYAWVRIGADARISSPPLDRGSRSSSGQRGCQAHWPGWGGWPVSGG